MRTTKGKTLAAFGGALGALALSNVAEGAVVAVAPVTFSNAATHLTLTLPQFGGAFLTLHDIASWSVSFIGGSASGIVAVAPGATITTGIAGLANSVATNPSNGTFTLAFKAGGNVGWFQINFGLAGAARFVGGAFENAGGPIIAGGGAPLAAPEPGTSALFALGSLALGAVGVRRRRKKRLAQAEKAAA